MVAPKQNQNVVALPTRQGLTRGVAEPSNRLAEYKKTAEWKQLSRPAQRLQEHRQNQITALVSTGQQIDVAIEDSGRHNLETIVSSMRDWQAEIDKLGDAITEEQRDALILAKSNQLASLLASQQTTLDHLNEVRDQAGQDIMNLPAHEWVTPTIAEQLESLITFGESDLEIRGIPPLSFWESVFNVPLMGLLADKKRRDHERARLNPTTSDESDGEGILDAAYTIQ